MAERRTQGEILNASVTFEVEKFVVTPHLNLVSSREIETRLKPGTMDVLVYLLEAAPRIVSANELLDKLWSPKIGDDSLIHRHISEIRKAFVDKAKHPKIVETIPKRGYRIIANVVSQRPIRPNNQPPQLTITTTGFEPSGSIPALRYWADGISEELSNSLIRKTELRVLSEPHPVGTAGNYVVRGRVRELGDQFRVSCQLLRHSDGEQIWSESYDVDPNESTRPESLAELIAHRVQSEIQYDDHRTVASLGYQGHNPAAVKAHLEAENFYRLARLGEAENWELYRRSLQRASELDNSFARVYFDIANFYMQRLGNTPHLEASLKAHEAIEKARLLVPNSAHGYQQLGQIHMNLDLDYQSASESFNRALKINPTAIWCYFGLARIALRCGDSSGCRQYLATACNLHESVDQPLFHAASGGYFAMAGDGKKARKQFDSALRIVSQGQQRGFSLRIKAISLAYMLGADRNEYLPVVEEALEIFDAEHHYHFAMFYGKTGQTVRARELLSNLPPGQLDCGALATGFIEIGEPDTAFRWLELGLEDRGESVIDGLRLAPYWDPLRNDIRYTQLLQRLYEIETLPDDASELKPQRS